MANTISVDIIANSKQFKKSMRDLGDVTGLNKLKRGIGAVGKGIAVAGAVGVAAVGALAVQTTKDLIRVERLGAQTSAVIKATGGAAGKSKKDIDRLATSLERATGAEAEVVTESSNLLLTFKDIKGTQFDSAQKAILDMGVAMNKGSLQGLDLKSTTIQVGKALNDPIKGITALSKVGVSFTEQQKEQIKAMVEAGDKAGAQKIILGELRSEFGGAAKAAGETTEGMWAKIQNRFGEIAESIMSWVIPALHSLTGWVVDNVLPAFSRFGEWLQTTGIARLRELGGSLRDNVLPVLQGLWGAVTRIVPVLVSLGGWVVRNRDWLGALAVVVGTVVLGIAAYVKVMAVWRAATAAAAAAQAVLNAVMAANPIGFIILAVAALAAGLVFFFTKTKTGQKAWKAFTGFLKAAWDNTVKALGSAWRWVQRNVFDKFVLGVRVLKLAFDIGKRQISNVFWKTVEALGNAYRWVKRNTFDKIVSTLGGMRTAFGNARTRASEIFWALGAALGRAWTWIKDKVFGKITGFLGKGGALRNAFSNAKDAIGSIWNGLKRKAATPINFVIGTVYNNGIRKALNLLPGVNLKEAELVKFARGGGVFGGIPGRDSVNALLMPGEHVLTTSDVKKLGGQEAVYKLRAAIQSGAFRQHGDVPAFAKGGALTAEQVARGQAWARQQAGKPYLWGATGLAGYDCSGLISALTQVIRGAYSSARLGATASFPWSGFKKGPGQFTVGSSKNFSGGIGHMAGNLGGMGVESRSGRGVIIGSGAMALNRFDGMWHLGAAGAAAAQGGGFFEAIQGVGDFLGNLKGWGRDLASIGGYGGLMKDVLKGVLGNVRTYLDKKFPLVGAVLDRIPTFDNGGTLGRGLNLVNNATGAPERLYREQGTTNVYITVEVPPSADLAAIGRETEKALTAFYKQNGRKRR